MPRPIHFEIHAADMDRAQAFYETMFGWTFSAAGRDDYRLIATGGGPGIDGGLVRRRGPPPVGGQPVDAFICTIGVDDLDVHLARAQDHGGSVALPRMAVPGVGWLAYVRDCEGNILGMIEQDPSAA